MYLLLNCFLLIFMPLKAEVSSNIISYEFKEIVVESKVKKGLRKWSIRWKRVFRPIYIFNKRVIFWLGIVGGLFLFMTLLGYLARRYNYEWNPTSVRTDGTYLLVATYLTAVFATALLLIWVPIVWIYRIIQELSWEKRFNRCFGFKKKR